MSVESEPAWPLGSYPLEFFHRSMVYAVHSARRVALEARERAVGAEWFDQARAAAADELSMLFHSLPKGVSFRLPGGNVDGELLETKFYIAANPLDAGDPYSDPILGTCTTIAAQSGEHVIATYVIDMFTGLLHCVQPYGSKIMVTRDPSSDVLIDLASEGDVAAVLGRVLDTTRLLLDGDVAGVGHEAFNRLLTSHDAKLLERRQSAGRSSTLGLLEVVRGRAAAYVRQAGRETAPWLDLPLIGFGRAGNIRAFSIEEDHLQETTLAPRVRIIGETDGETDDETDEVKIERAPAAEDGVTTRDHGLLYVRGDRAAEVLQHLPVRFLPRATKKY
jgi:hypothetical protein